MTRVCEISMDNKQKNVLCEMSVHSSGMIRDHTQVLRMRAARAYAVTQSNFSTAQEKMSTNLQKNFFQPK